LKPNLSAAGPLCEDRDSRTVMTGLVPVIHVVKLLESLGMAVNGAAWMAGTSPGHDGEGVSIALSLDMCRIKKSLN
jgi:hypothetical protein